MARFYEVPCSFLKQQQLRFFLNMIRNYQKEVTDRDFFDLVLTCYHAADVMEILWVAFAERAMHQRLEEAEVKLERDNVHITLQKLWNCPSTREVCRVVIEEIVSQTLNALSGKEVDEDPVKQRLEALCALLKLDELERDILLLSYVKARMAFEFPVNVRSHERQYYIAMALDRAYAEVLKTLHPRCRLRMFDLLDDDWDLQRGALESYLSGGESETRLLHENFYCQEPLDDVLPLHFFGERLEEKAALILKLLAAKNGKLNILFYGVPGTGKTSFAQAIAKASGLRTFSILQGVSSSSESRSRRIGIEACNSCEDPNESVMIIDEADELLSRADGEKFWVKSTEKGVTNTLLDEMKMPAFWIVNIGADKMASSVRRRFDYSIRFDCLNGEQRIQIWKNSVDKLALHDLIPAEKIKGYATKYHANAGGIAFVLQNVKRLKPSADTVEAQIDQLMQPHCQLMRYATSQVFAPAKDYSLEGLNIKSTITLPQIVQATRNFAQQTYAVGDCDLPRMNLLLYGAPGSGKTEFVKFLGAELNKKVLFKRASDLLGPYVGMTEQLIARAFRQAEDEEAILFFDEVDSLVQDRRNSSRSWEVSQVNEILQQMEAYNGIFIAATNLRTRLDQAIMRRFTFKVEFDYLADEGKQHFFEHFFKTPLTEVENLMLQRISCLTPGDFRTVRQSLYYLGETVTNTDRLNALRRESEAKLERLTPDPIGFFTH